MARTLYVFLMFLGCMASFNVLAADSMEPTGKEDQELHMVNETENRLGLAFIRKNHLNCQTNYYNRSFTLTFDRGLFTYTCPRYYIYGRCDNTDCTDGARCLAKRQVIRVNYTCFDVVYPATYNSYYDCGCRFTATTTTTTTTTTPTPTTTTTTPPPPPTEAPLPATLAPAPANGTTEDPLFGFLP